MIILSHIKEYVMEEQNSSKIILIDRIETIGSIVILIGVVLSLIFLR